MATKEIETRVASLEQEIALLKKKMSALEKPAAWWQQISGAFAGDADFEEAVKLGREFREGETDLGLK